MTPWKIENARLGVSLAFLGLGACITQPPIPDLPLAREVKYRNASFTFPTGLRAIVYEEPDATRTYVDVSYAVGERDEEAGQGGLAHLVEHLTFRSRQAGTGTPTLGERIRGAGCEFNATTQWDSTDFFEEGRPDQLSGLLRIEAARMASPITGITSEEFTAENAVISNELRLRNQFGAAFEQLDIVRDAVFAPAQAVEAPTSLSSAFTLEVAKGWTTRFFRPERAVVVVVSPVHAEDAMSLVGREFGAMALPPAGTPPVAPFKPQPETSPRVPTGAGQALAIDGAVTHPELWMAWVVPGADSPETLTAAVASLVVSAQLHAILRGDGRVRHIDVRYLPNDHDGLILVHLTLKDLSALAWAQDRSAYISRTVMKSGITRNLDAIQRLLSVAGLEQFQSPPLSSMAQSLRARGISDFIAAFRSSLTTVVNRDALSDFVGNYLKADQVHAVVIRPDLSPEEEDVADEPEPARTPTAEGLSSSPLSRPLSPEAIEAIAGHPGLESPVRHTLSNGLQVVVMPRKGFPLVASELQIWTPATRAQLPAKAVAWAARGRRGNWTAGSVGAFTFSTSGRASIILFGGGPAGNLPNILHDFSAWALYGEPGVSESHQGQEALVRAAKKFEQRARRSAAPPAWSDPRLPSTELENVTAGSAAAWWSHAVTPGNATLIIAGEVTADDQLWKDLELWFGSWSGVAAPITPEQRTPLTMPTQRRIQFANQSGAHEAFLRVRVATPMSLGFDRTANHAVASWLRSATEQVLRVQYGMSYGIDIAAGEDLRGEVFSLQGFVNPGAAADALKHIFEVLDNLKKKPLSPAELASVQVDLAADLGQSLQTALGVANALESSAVKHLPDDYWDKLPADIAALTPERIQAAAARLSIGNEDVLVSGRQETVYPTLLQAGLAVELVGD